MYDLKGFNMSSEAMKLTIIIPSKKDEIFLQDIVKDLERSEDEVIVSLEKTRAKSLNSGADIAKGNFFLFLHADSRLDKESIIELKNSLKRRPNHIHYFDLVFDSSGLLTINARLANLRSHILGMPYGDQGLCFSRKVFDRIGGFPDDHQYGEDLRFILRAKILGIKVFPINLRLLTSARKYREKGWLYITLLHQWRFLRIVFSEVNRFIRLRS